MAHADTQPASSSQPALLPIRYERTGGFAGTNDVMKITPAGAVVVQGKLMGSAKGQLTAEQIAALVPLFADWKSLKPNYAAPAGSADGFNIKIRYGTTEVSASEMNASLPAAFKSAPGLGEDRSRREKMSFSDGDSEIKKSRKRAAEDALWR